jgi:hypothetical protein
MIARMVQRVAGLSAARQKGNALTGALSQEPPTLIRWPSAAFAGHVHNVR